MEDIYTIPLTKIIDEFEMEILYEPTNINEILISSSDINRPGLQLAGFLDNFDSNRLQIMGRSEFTFLEGFAVEDRREALDKYFELKFPALLITRGLQLYPEMLEYAEKNNLALLRTEDVTSSFMSAIISFLNVQIAPRRTRHGVLVEVYGEGILILGESGVGKSEATIELVKRGSVLLRMMQLK